MNQQHPVSAIHQVLGAAFDQLPAEVKAAHDHPGQLLLRGTANVEIGPGFLRWLACALIGLPRRGNDQPTTVSLATDAIGVDHWHRNFDGRRYHSALAAGTGRLTGKLVEQQGPMTNVFALEARPDRLIFRLERFAMLGIFLPAWLSPKCYAEETGYNGQFGFDITIDAPLVGRLVVYRGLLSA
jgi:hypothetical protein